MNLPGKPHIVHKADAVYHRGANNAACLSPWPAVRRRHTAAAAASAVGAKGPQPAQEAGEPDEEEEEYEEFDEHEDEWEDEVEYEEGEYEEIEEGAEHAVQQQASSPVAAAVTTAAAVPRNIKQIPLGQQTVEFTAVRSTATAPSAGVAIAARSVGMPAAAIMARKVASHRLQQPDHEYPSSSTSRTYVLMICSQFEQYCGTSAYWSDREDAHTPHTHHTETEYDSDIDKTERQNRGTQRQH